jgi:hypothetical protein
LGDLTEHSAPLNNGLTLSPRESYRPSFFLLPSRTYIYFLIFGKAIIEGRSSLHDVFGR